MDVPNHPLRSPTDKEIEEYVTSLKKSFKEVHPRALVNIKAADTRNKEYYDKRHHKE